MLTINNNEMDWKNVHLRFTDMKRGDVSVCKWSHSLWNDTMMTIAYYDDGRLIDHQALDGLHPDDVASNDITDFVEEYCITENNVAHRLPYNEKLD